MKALALLVCSLIPLTAAVPIHAQGLAREPVLLQDFGQPRGWQVATDGELSALYYVDDAIGWILLAASEGDLAPPFGDGRNTGLALDALLLASVANPGLLQVPLDAGGSGATPPLPPLASGQTFYAVGLSLDLSTVAFGELTDVVPVTAP
ncbi:MAG: hypothetical protein AAF682_28220 [Planctomycetota bacterium]